MQLASHGLESYVGHVLIGVAIGGSTRHLVLDLVRLNYTQLTQLHCMTAMLRLLPSAWVRKQPVFPERNDVWFIDVQPVFAQQCFLIGLQAGMLTYKKGSKGRLFSRRDPPSLYQLLIAQLDSMDGDEIRVTAVTRATELTQRRLPLLRLGSNSTTHRPSCSLKVLSLRMLVLLTWSFLAKATSQKHRVLFTFGCH